MSEFRNTQRDIVTDREPGTVESCRNLVDGTTFNAEYEETDPLTLNTMLGDDLRETAKIHISDRTAALNLTMAQQVAVNLFGEWSVFTILKRVNNPGSSQVTFSLMLKTDQDS